MLKTRTSCRACGTSALVPVLSLGDQYLAGNFAMSSEHPPVQRRIPLDLVRCAPEKDENACGLVQLRHTVPGDLMFTSYGYQSGINESMVRHLRDLAHSAEERVGGLASGDLVVDIGANDGTTLAQYRGPAKLVGFEPSLVQPRGNVGAMFIRDYFSSAALKRHVGDAKARIVTSIAMFYDIEDPRSFVREVADVLAEDGIWITEMHYLPAMLEGGGFDAILHEHLAYYSLSTFSRLIESCGFRVIDAEENASNGGSLRITAARAGSALMRTPEARARLYRLQIREFELELDTAKPFQAFATRIEKLRADLVGLLAKLRAEKKRVFGIGASTKGNVILQYCGIGPEHLVGIADRNPAKIGGKTLGSGIPIVSEETMRAAKPDYLLALPYHFLDAFLERERDLLAGGTKFIVPLPEVRIVP